MGFFPLCLVLPIKRGLKNDYARDSKGKRSSIIHDIGKHSKKA
jgi:hypothetical protein